MDNKSYSLFLLQNALRDEIIAKTDAINYFQGTHCYDEKLGSQATRQAFEESESLANERIPDLQSAIEKLKQTRK